VGRSASGKLRFKRMELPLRQPGDQFLAAGEFTALRRQLRGMTPSAGVSCLVVCAYDHRTRMLPFLYADVFMAPAGPRAIAAAMIDAGVTRTRLVLQQWNPNIRPSTARLDGRIPDLLLISSLQVHRRQCEALIEDACTMPSHRRPLIVAGGPLMIYEPWAAFGADPSNPWSADVAITGEEPVLLALLKRLLLCRRGDETLRATFARARHGGMLADIPGLVYARADSRDTRQLPEELSDTGIQKLLTDLDELPDAASAFRVLEPPGRGAGLGRRPLSGRDVRRHSPIAALMVTAGCKYTCPYCPIPAYNQRRHRTKSPRQTVEEMRRLTDEFGFRYFSLVGGNFFNDHAHAAEVLDAIARSGLAGPNRRDSVKWGTEATVRDALAMKEHLPLAGRAGMTALWLGVEDITGRLIRKGQSEGRTLELFDLLRQAGISPMPMLMHHDDQPLLTRKSDYGLLNQVRLLRRRGALDLQVLMTVPMPGARDYNGLYRSGRAYESVGGRPIPPYVLGGNFVVASRHRAPWRKQLNIVAAYLYFYNPLRLLWALVRPKNTMRIWDAASQALGLWGVLRTAASMIEWSVRLAGRRVVRASREPASHIPMRGTDGGPASHL